jgi:radical SAM protein with 4Fe4S-binding SPASM domain
MSLNPVLHSPPKISIGLTEACPYHCRHCYADCAAAPKPGELSAERWIRLLADLAGRGVVQAYIEGGEPLAKPGIMDLLRSITPVMMTLLRTHGWGVTQHRANELADAGLGRMLVDLMGADAATHDRHTGVAGSFAAACDAIRWSARAGMNTDALVILTRQTAPQLSRIAALVAELGGRRLGVLRLYPLGRARAAWSELAISLADQTAALAALTVPAGLRIMQSWHPNDHNCCWQAAAINAFGRAIGCMYLRDYVDYGDATVTPYDEIWRDNPLNRQLRSGDVEETCGECSSTQGSHGGCRSTAYAWSGRWTAPDPFDTKLNHGVDLTQLPPMRPAPVRAGSGDAGSANAVARLEA